MISVDGLIPANQVNCCQHFILSRECSFCSVLDAFCAPAGRLYLSFINRIAHGRWPIFKSINFHSKWLSPIHTSTMHWMSVAKDNSPTANVSINPRKMRFPLILVCFVYCSVALIVSTNVSIGQPLSKQRNENTDIEAIVSSLDKKPNLILSQKIKTDKKSFFGLILIPCEWCVVEAKRRARKN